jgi:hypothetical protein
MLTNKDKAKAAKKKAREKRIVKERNIRNCAATKRFSLNVVDGKKVLTGMKEWDNLSRAKEFIAEMEELKKSGEEVLPAYVVDRKTRKIVLKIEGSLKGAAPDKIADGVKANSMESQVE